MTKQNTMTNQTTSSERILGMTYTAMMVVVMAVCSWISIPTAVPFTLQTFGVYMALLLLGGKRGTLAIALYILLGAIGVPVFAGFSGGAGVLLGPTGGYILGFLVTGISYWLVTGLARRRASGSETTETANASSGSTRGHLADFAGLLIGVVCLYTFGTLWFMHVYAAGGEAISLMTALAWCVIPFLAPEVGKFLLAFALTRRLKPRM